MLWDCEQFIICFSLWCIEGACSVGKWIDMSKGEEVEDVVVADECEDFRNSLTPMDTNVGFSIWEFLDVLWKPSVF